MNLKDISSKISNPVLCNSNDIESFRQLNELYPYAQIFSILYLKSLSNDEALFFDEALYKNAYKITDRTKLFHFLNEKKEEASIDFKETDTIIPVHKNEEVEVEIEAEKVTDDLMQTTQPTDHKSLDIEIISHVISHAFGEEIEEVHQETKLDTNVSSAPDIEVKEDKEEINRSPKKFTEWLKNGKKSTPQVPKKSKNEIINSFIEIEPSISKPTKEFYSPIKQAQKSVDDDSVMYSETLASILALQGNYPRAIIAYEQLCLTIPEKKVYFVQKIKELKEKLTT